MVGHACEAGVARAEGAASATGRHAHAHKTDVAAGVVAGATASTTGGAGARVVPGDHLRHHALTSLRLPLEIPLTQTQSQLSIMQIILLLTHIPQPEIIRRIDRPFDRYIILQFRHREPLQRVHILDRKAFENGTDVRVEDRKIFPDFDGEDEGSEEEAAPVDGMEGEVPEFCHAFDID